MSDTNPTDLAAFAREVGAKLIGTCKSLSEIEGADEAMSSPLFCDVLDSITICCTSCGWWVEPGDEDEDGECAECGEDNG
jgi:hypothetical protein